MFFQLLSLRERQSVEELDIKIAQVNAQASLLKEVGR
jgi:hypothetical protein